MIAEQGFLMEPDGDEPTPHSVSVFVDLSTVRPDGVSHPCKGEENGYKEIQEPRLRYSLIDHESLTNFLGIPSINRLVTPRVGGGMPDSRKQAERREVLRGWRGGKQRVCSHDEKAAWFEGEGPKDDRIV